MDAIRGLAALIVFINHSHWVFFLTGEHSSKGGTDLGRIALGFPDSVARIGPEAMIVFFVLSGYLVGGSVLRQLRSGRWSWTSYLTQRLTRLLIVLLPAMLLGLVLDHIGLHAGYRQLGPTEDLAYQLRWPVIIGNLLFLQTIWVPPAGSNTALWSLAAEFWYYLAFPFCVMALLPHTRVATRIRNALIAVIILVFVGRHVAQLFPLWVLGAMVSIIPGKLSLQQSRLFGSGLAAAIVAFMLYARTHDVYIIVAWYVLGILAAGLVYAFARNTAPGGHGLYTKAARYFSRISYSLYLFHLPMVTFLCGVLLNNPFHPWTHSPRHLAMWVLGDVLVLALISCLWFAFEGQTDKLRKLVLQFAQPKVPDLNVRLGSNAQ